MKNYILFDLDGTLTNPGEGIANSVRYALERFGITETCTERLYRFVGPPLWDSFERYYGFDKAQANTAVGYYREYYNDKGIFECSVYAGIKDMLKALAERTLVVATSKPTAPAQRVLKHFGLYACFSFVAGSELDGSRVKKADVIAYALESCGIEPSQAVMIGDREHDIIGAKTNGLLSVGVLYGYGEQAELESAQPDYLVTDVNELRELLLGL